MYTYPVWPEKFISLLHSIPSPFTKRAYTLQRIIGDSVPVWITMVFSESVLSSFTIGFK